MSGETGPPIKTPKAKKKYIYIYICYSGLWVPACPSLARSCCWISSSSPRPSSSSSMWVWKRFLLWIMFCLKQCCWSGMIIPDPDPAFRVSDPAYFIQAYLEIIKNTLNSIKKKNLPFTVYAVFLFHTQSRVHRPKIINTFFIYLLDYFLLDPDPQHWPLYPEILQYYTMTL